MTTPDVHRMVPLPKPTYEYRAALDRVVDGDTVYLKVDLGFRVWVTVEFRLARIDAPEVVGETKPAGVAATNYLVGLLSGREILVRSDKSRDKYGRWIGELFIPGGYGVWLSVSDEMLSSGHAAPYPAK